MDKLYQRYMKNVLVLLALVLLAAGSSSRMAAFASEADAQTMLYGIGSTSKVITAAAVMKLADEGHIDLDQPLVHYLPEFSMADDRYRFITPRMLLDHSSGLPGSTLTNSMLLGDPDSDNHDRLLERLKPQRLKADPGDFFVYCNDGFTLAEILVERVSQMSFTEYLEYAFASPLSLSNLKTPESSGGHFRLAPVYDRQTGKELPPEAPNVIGSGGIYATAEDLCRLSQIFMQNQGSAAGILSPQAADAMESSEYDRVMNPDGNDTVLSFGLGWDSINAYPFSRYGINALVKGGDTTYYHASLTVLPEENISCAVLSSGGSSTACQLAVQEILLAYLDEIERIEREDDHVSPAAFQNPGTSNMPPDLTAYSGWYSGGNMMDITIDERGSLTLSSTGTGQDKTQIFSYGKDGSFYSTGSGYMGMDGILTRGSNGTVGRSALDFFTDNHGRTYLMAGTHETYPGLGSYTSYYPVAQKLITEPSDPSSIQNWQKQSGKEFYLVSEKYSSAFYFNRFMVQPHVLSEPEGYLTFQDGALTPARITGPEKAQFFQQIPGHAGRDLSDYRLLNKNGQLYLETGSSRYLCEDQITTLSAKDTVISIGADGDSRWFSIDGAAHYGFVTIEAPSDGAYYIYDTIGKELTCIASSYTQKSGEKFLLPANGRIVFAGKAGQSFSIRFTGEHEIGAVSGIDSGRISSVQNPSSQL